ncbi:beta-ribofuranosylaminobenzene 5'-phosphate synthase family protein [Shewanella frigidimarina]|uniref:beta-ribofuranosylaminobenzene 5'-phosphate synthase family protein n=1 Tax=Shewanella frigidimarina TaxID=56812 RepID=UPI003D7AFD53
MLKIKIPQRLHINLLSMHSCDYRKNSGIGLAIINKELFLEAKIHSTSIIEVENYCNHPERLQIIIELLKSTKKKYKLEYGVKIKLCGSYFFHVGLGTSTAVTLACLEALFLTNNKTITDNELIKISERGGTSGIGINTYFHGGLIIDSGTKSNNQKHKPSSYIKPKVHSKILAKCNFPNWNLGILIPNERDYIYDEKELIFFEKNCPIPKDEAYFASYLATFGTLASAKDNDYELFCHSINETQKTYWKRKEISQNKFNNLRINRLLSLGVDCAGISSFGNSIYFFDRDPEDVIRKMSTEDDFLYFEYDICNSGRIIC